MPLAHTYTQTCAYFHRGCFPHRRSRCRCGTGGTRNGRPRSPSCRPPYWGRSRSPRNRCTGACAACCTLVWGPAGCPRTSTWRRTRWWRRIALRSSGWGTGASWISLSWRGVPWRAPDRTVHGGRLEMTHEPKCRSTVSSWCRRPTRTLPSSSDSTGLPHDAPTHARAQSHARAHERPACRTSRCQEDLTAAWIDVGFSDDASSLTPPP